MKISLKEKYVSFLKYTLSHVPYHVFCLIIITHALLQKQDSTVVALEVVMELIVNYIVVDWLMITYSIRLKKTKKKHVSRDVRKSVIGRAQSYNFPLCILSKIKHKIQNHKTI